MFYALTENSYLHHKINLALCLAPIAKVGNDNETFYQVFHKTIPRLVQLTQSLGMHELFGANWNSINSKLGYIINRTMH